MVARLQRIIALSWQRDLLHRSHTHLAYAIECRNQRLDICALLDLPVVIRVEYGGTNGLYGTHSLRHGHCVWLIYGQEGDIYALHRQYIVVIFGVASNIYCRASECEDVTAILS